MDKFIFTETDIDGVIIVQPHIFEDNRGYFYETYNKQNFEMGGITDVFVQDNESVSSKGVLRGLHYQEKHPQSKLVRVTEGKVFDVAVDIRFGSPTFGKWVGVVLSDENKKQLYIPKGLAHGFLVLSEKAKFNYKCGDFYYADDQRGIMYNDKDININWEDYCEGEFILSQKDTQNPTFKQYIENGR
ncbi:MAG: dTDP-4-dehydrorhamnose 3,5-epimerase [Clostridia bacterium]|nr:dTDP-4-dehydrorhamnose 3,5-epimerase [Clostridia bacterium]